MGAFEYLNSLADSDGDGLPDYWEQGHGLDPSRATSDDGPTGDPDSDGANNSAEFVADTDPKDRSSVLALSAIATGSNTVSLAWHGGRDARQFIACSPTRSNTNWVFILTNEPPTTVSNVFIRVHALQDAAFYRITAERL